MRSVTAASLAALVLALPAPAFNGSKLAIATKDESGGKQKITVEIKDAQAAAVALLGLGNGPGTTTFDLGTLGVLTLGIDLSFPVVFLGVTKDDGNRKQEFTAAQNLGVTVFAQAVTIGVVPNFPPGPGELPVKLDLCASNVVSVKL